MLEYFEPNNCQERVLQSLRTNFSFKREEVSAVELFTTVPQGHPSFKLLNNNMIKGDINCLRRFTHVTTDGMEGTIIFYAIHFTNVVVLVSVVNMGNNSVEPQIISYKSLLMMWLNDVKGRI